MFLPRSSVVEHRYLPFGQRRLEHGKYAPRASPTQSRCSQHECSPQAWIASVRRAIRRAAQEQNRTTAFKCIGNCPPRFVRDRCIAEIDAASLNVNNGSHCEIEWQLTARLRSTRNRIAGPTERPASKIERSSNARIWVSRQSSLRGTRARPKLHSSDARSQRPRSATASYVDCRKLSNSRAGSAARRTASYGSRNSRSVVSYAAVFGATTASRNPGGSGYAYDCGGDIVHKHRLHGRRIQLSDRSTAYPRLDQRVRLAVPLSRAIRRRSASAGRRAFFGVSPDDAEVDSSPPKQRRSCRSDHGRAVHHGPSSDQRGSRRR